uniref:Transmembrane protein n=1 Tax=Rhabditophanes sp. KR3021 TaxID=114890 RepID=A0AC35TRD6_9BILA
MRLVAISLLFLILISQLSILTFVSADTEESVVSTATKEATKKATTEATTTKSTATKPITTTEKAEKDDSGFATGTFFFGIFMGMILMVALGYIYILWMRRKANATPTSRLY